MIGSGEVFGTEAIGSNAAPRWTETAKAGRRTTLLVMSREHLDRSKRSLRDVIIRDVLILNMNR